MSDTLRVNVRTIAEFYTEGGDLIATGNMAERMREGVKGHQKLQSDYSETWEKEVSLSLDVNEFSVPLRLYGRADGLCRKNDPPVIEEIKTTERPVSEIGENDIPAHWAQAELYGAMFAEEAQCESVTLRLTYLNLKGGSVSFSRTLTHSELTDRMLEYVRPYAAWLENVLNWRILSRQSMNILPFPFERYRDGQRSMAANVYVALRDKRRLLCQAPTGIGKTAASLYPALKALGEGLIDRIFFLTARTTGQRSAEHAAEKMRSLGLCARSVTLSAREKVCIQPDLPCSPDTCPRARGYYDRRRDALYEALDMEDFSPPRIAELAEKHMLCPFEFSLDLSEIADVVICDYNYVFDPRVKLQRFFTNKSDAGLLIDEAHNLPARARSMLSASLSHRAFHDLRMHVGKESGRSHPLYKTLTALLSSFKALRTTFEEETVQAEPPAELLTACRDALTSLSEFLHTPSAWSSELTDRYFELLTFVRSSENDGETYRTLLRPDGKSMSHVTLWCVDPAPHIHRALSRVHGAALFSATLSPMNFYRDLMGLSEESGDALLFLPSPFPSENLLVMHTPLSVRYRQREQTLPELASLIRTFIGAHVGNYMIFFPSYAYLRQTLEILKPMLDDSIRLIVQERDMDDRARNEFLEHFVPDPTHTTCALTVLGGSFAEGIDLTADRLCGAVIVGTGVPQIGMENDSLREVYEARFSDGYRYAYMYPGMERVLQAAGRIIRTETDRGALLLIDQRWSDREHLSLLPPHYHPVRIHGITALNERLATFWNAF